MKNPQPLLIVGSLAFDDLDMPSGNFRDVLGGAATYSANPPPRVTPPPFPQPLQGPLPGTPLPIQVPPAPKKPGGGGGS